MTERQEKFVEYYSLTGNAAKSAVEAGYSEKTAKQKGYELKKLLSNGFKLEVEALISKDISYVTEEYVPARLADQDFLD